MKILGIETSCDETAVCLLDASGNIEKPLFSVLGNALYSQVKTHAKYGGVFPALAKREHAKNLVPLLKKALEDANLLTDGAGEQLKYFDERDFRRRDGAENEPAREYSGTACLSREKYFSCSPALETQLKKILEREPGLFEALKEFLKTTDKPKIDLIAVTAGPGLEPALWVGINFARALGFAWGIPVIPTNHMEGHIASVLLNSTVTKNVGDGADVPSDSHGYFSGEKFLVLAPSRSQGFVGNTSAPSPQTTSVVFPALALLVSGGHTQLVLAKNWLDYKILGETRDDAVGEAFDKVARILGLPYPGGPEISKLAAEAREKDISSDYKLPRPMIDSDNFDFSFSGLKTAVLYTVKKIPELTPNIKNQLAVEFENAITDVLLTKTKKALGSFEIKTMILGGGVTANKFIRKSFEELIRKEFPDIMLLIPTTDLSTDNAIMIAMAGYLNFISGKKTTSEITANGNLRL